MTRARLVQFIVLCAGALAASLLPFALDTYELTVVLTLAMWIALTQSWTIFSGFTGYVSLGHVVFYGLGAYLTAALWGVMPFGLEILLAGFLAGAFALAIGAPSLRVRGPYFVILTFGIAELVKYAVIALDAALGKASRLIFGAPDLVILYQIMVTLAATATALVILVRPSKFGRGLIAIREDEEAAETIGVPVAAFKTLAFALSAVIPGMVGAVMALRSTYFEATQVFNPTVSFTIVAMAIIGGSDDARGALLGPLFLVMVSELLWDRLPVLYMLVLGATLIVFVLFAPRGITGVLLRPRNAER